MNSVSPLWFIAGFPLYFVALWTSVMFILSKVGAWSRIAANYPATIKPRGETFRMVSASMGMTNYNNCLTAVVADEGLFLQPWAPFRMFHPPLLIPWNAFSPFVESQILWATRFKTTVKLRGGGQVPLILMPRALQVAMQGKIEMGAVELSDSAWSN